MCDAIHAVLLPSQDPSSRAATGFASGPGSGLVGQHSQRRSGNVVRACFHSNCSQNPFSAAPSNQWASGEICSRAGQPEPVAQRQGSCTISSALVDFRSHEKSEDAGCGTGFLPKGIVCAPSQKKDPTAMTRSLKVQSSVQNTPQTLKK